MDPSTSFSAALPVLLAWALLWSLGGIWLARAAFRLNENEEALAGIAFGFILQNWLVNLLARVIDLPWVSWLSAGLVLLAGVIVALRVCGPRGLLFSMRLWPLALFVLVTGIFFIISRGMAIFDDFAHLPTVSLMAAGDIPPHFSLDPGVLYGYHHFLLLFSAQSMRVAGLPPWVALDVGRALTFGLAILLGGLWTLRLTHNRLAGVVGAAALAFASGGRWLMLFLSRGPVARLGSDIQLIGSGASSGPNLVEAMSGPWVIEGDAALAFPFAFANGIFPPGVISGHGANGMAAFVVILLLLLTASRWREPIGAAVLTSLVFSIWGLLTEAELVIFLGGWGLVALVYVLQKRSLRLPSSLWLWLGVIASGAVIGFLQGGAWTDLIFRFIQRVTTGVSAPSYQTVGFQLGAPVVVSSHLGPLSLFDPAQVVVALFELGPLLLALPLLAAFGWKAFRNGRWFEAATAAAAFLSLTMVFVQFTGSTGVRNTPRLYVFMPVLAVFAVPLVWRWAEHRSQTIRAAAAGWVWLLTAGGMVMFGIELIATQQPVYSAFLTPADAAMYQAHWNRLEPERMVFDENASRSTTLFGRFTDAAYTWRVTGTCISISVFGMKWGLPSSSAGKILVSL